VDLHLIILVCLPYYIFDMHRRFWLFFPPLKPAENRNTGWSKSLCAPDDYNTESYK
jgi:hypothetical protein